MISPAAQFQADATRVAADVPHRSRIHEAMGKYALARTASQAAFLDWEAAREFAAATKRAALEKLDEHLVAFEKQAVARGTTVHWAMDAAEARAIILEVIRAAEARSIIKSKLMTGEEIGLNEALEASGYGVVESDLGEFVQQLRQEAPYHFVFPCMHLVREEISEIFEKHLGAAPTQDPAQLTEIARQFLRRKYLEADVGITGANFIVAETGQLSITENEGNARLSAALPRVMISLVGIEKVVPRLADLAVFLPMLATAGTGQPLTCYNTLYGGPRQPGEPDGPEAWHVVLLDNHRTRLLSDPEQREALQCIRCGACLNVCPIFQNIGGFSYGTTYQGPIGSVITPHFRGLRKWAHLSAASSLCGACTETCPVKIDLHHHLLRNRRDAANAPSAPGQAEGIAWRFFIHLTNHRWLFSLVGKAARLLQPLHRLIHGTPLDPLRAWTATRDLPRIAPQSFRHYWNSRRP